MKSEFRNPRSETDSVIYQSQVRKGIVMMRYRVLLLGPMLVGGTGLALSLFSLSSAPH